MLFPPRRIKFVILLPPIKNGISTAFNVFLRINLSFTRFWVFLYPSVTFRILLFGVVLVRVNSQCNLRLGLLMVFIRLRLVCGPMLGSGSLIQCRKSWFSFGNSVVMLYLCVFCCSREVLIWILYALCVANPMNPCNISSWPVLVLSGSGTRLKIIIGSHGDSSEEPTLRLLVFSLLGNSTRCS